VLGYLKRTWPQAAELHAAIRRLHDSHEILGVIEGAPAFKDSNTRTPKPALGRLGSTNAFHSVSCTIAGAVQ